MKIYGEGASLMTSALDMLPPQNLEAERKVLGGCLLDNDQIDDVVGILKPHDFYRDSHQVIWRAAVWLREQCQPVDNVTLAETLIRYKQFDKCGGDDTLAEIANSVPHSANTRYHAEIVREKSISRQIIQAATEIIRLGYSNTVTAKQLVEHAESSIFAISEGRDGESGMSLAEMLSRAKMIIDSRADGEVCGIMSGFPKLDAMTGGFRKGQLVIVAARPGQGKTSFAMQLALNAGELEAALIFSMEMSHEELGLRTLATLAGIDLQFCPISGDEKIDTRQRRSEMWRACLVRHVDDVTADLRGYGVGRPRQSSSG